MPHNEKRIVVGFYGESKSDALAASTVLREQSVSKNWVLDGKSWPIGAPEILQQFRKTLLEDEYLVAGVLHLPRQKRALDKLRESGEHPTFILNGFSADLDPSACGTAEERREQTEQTFAALAATHTPESVAPKTLLRDIFRLAESRLAKAYQGLMNSALLGHAVNSTGEWLLDNNYLFEVHGAEVKAFLPRKYGQNVPGIAARNGLPRIYDLACKLTSQLDFAVTADSIAFALNSYQQQSILNMAELWLFPVVLRLALYDGISRIAARAASAQDTREYVYFWTNRLVSAARVNPAALDSMLEVLQADPILQNEQFVSVLTEQLHEEDRALARFQESMARILPDSLGDIIRRQHHVETADRITVANAIGSLRALGQIDFTQIFVEVSRVERTLNQDPAGNYSKADFATRDACRQSVERLARLSGLPETAVAQRAVQLAEQDTGKLASHVEFYLLGAGELVLEASLHAKVTLATQSTRWVRRHPTFTYITAIFLLTAILAVLFAIAAWEPASNHRILIVLLALAAAFPLSDFSIQIVNTIAVSILPPAALPRMNFQSGIPASCSTLVVVPMMLVNRDVLDQELRRLETRFVGNIDPNLQYALLADFTDAASQHTPTDEALLIAAREGIDSLRRRYSTDCFHLLYRDRSWSESEQAWIGRERKRGKIEDLNALLCGDSSSLIEYPPLPRTIVYAITLDADTRLPAEAARRLIETIAHPLNQVQLSADGRQRLSGYTIIQPRASIVLPGAGVSHFTRIFGDARGTDPYCHAVSDLYQDLFGESIFHGKAIYNVAAMHSILHERFPAETILSHDLIEGAYLGVAADTKIELFETLPVDYPSFARRQHRWIRGDWQIAPWIDGKVPNGANQLEPNPLPLVNRWQVLDNLRRSLVAPVSILILFAAWLFSHSAGISSLLIAVAVGLPSLAPVFDRLARNASRQTQGLIGMQEELQRTFVYFALLPHQAWIAVDAIARVLYRRHVSHRHLLEWQTAEAVNKSGRHTSSTLKECIRIAALSSASILLLWLNGNLASAWPFLLAWATSPLVVVWLGRATPNTFPALPDEEDSDFLRLVARRTWRTFDDLVGPQSNWLPPDNIQLSLREEIAQRTSPTNIGLWFTSLLAASDFNFITPGDLLKRCRATLDTLDTLERYEGHWLNWYAIDTLKPLLPRYVSTVDSGNLLVCLWVLEAGLDDTFSSQVPGPQSLLGIQSTLNALSEVMGKDAAIALPLQNLRNLLRKAQGYEIVDRLKQARLQIQNLKRTLGWFASAQSEAAYWVGKLERQCNDWLAYTERYLGWMDTLVAAPDQLLRSIHPSLVKARLDAIHVIPSLEAMAEGTHAELNRILDLARGSEGASQSAWLAQLRAEYQQSQAAARDLRNERNELRVRIAALASGIDMGFLYDKQRKLFGIGYEVGTPMVFASHYDLLASECRLASIAAIAKGDVRVEHWHALGRPYVSVPKGQMLLSWSGTMFEYLMPLLFLRPFENSLLAEAARIAVAVQRDYAEKMNRPWGISEAAYSALDANQIYQYRAFGVPSLGLKPSRESDFVVSPYSTLLALQVDSAAAVENLRVLADMKMMGPMGFYESIDYSRASGPSGPEGVIIYSYMSHHQGMGLTALANTLLDTIMQRRFHGNLRVRSVESLLYERVPTTRSLLRHARQTTPGSLPVKPEDLLDRNPNQIGSLPNVQVLGNGEYSVLLTNSGAGYSRWRDYDITRWRADTTLDSHGTWFYLRDMRSSSVWSPVIQPIGTQTGTMSVAFSPSRVKFDRTAFGIDHTYEICVSPDDNAEIRRFTFANRGLRSRHLEITSFLELALASHAADRAHPAFSKLFVQTEWLADRFALIAHRRPRSPQDPEIWAAHMLVAHHPGLEIQYDGSRENFVGRNRNARNPLALEGDLSATTGTVIDPAFAIRCRFFLEAREGVELSFLTMAASSREALLTLMDQYAK